MLATANRRPVGSRPIAKQNRITCITGNAKMNNITPTFLHIRKKFFCNRARIFPLDVIWKNINKIVREINELELVLTVAKVGVLTLQQSVISEKSSNSMPPLGECPDAPFSCKREKWIFVVVVVLFFQLRDNSLHSTSKYWKSSIDEWIGFVPNFYILLLFDSKSKIINDIFQTILYRQIFTCATFGATFCETFCETLCSHRIIEAYCEKKMVFLR